MSKCLDRTQPFFSPIIFLSSPLQAADLRVVAEIYGLSTENEVTLSNGVHFVPLASLAPSANSKAILAQFEVGPGLLHSYKGSPPAAAVYELPNVPASEDRELAAKDAGYNSAVDNYAHVRRPNVEDCSSFNRQ